jgi:hypothetical protein
MQFVATTPIALILCAAILWTGPLRGAVLVFLTMPFDSAAAVNLTGLGSITLTDATTLAMAVSLGLHGRWFPGLLGSILAGPYMRAMVLLLVIIGIGAVFLPRVFYQSTEVYAFLRGAGGPRITLTPLHPTGSNIGQSFRMGMSGLVFFLMLHVFRTAHGARHVFRAMVAASVAHILLSLADLMTPLFGRNLLGPLRTAMVNVLDNQVLFGMRRLIAGFPEPSGFGAYTIGLYGFWLRLWFGRGGILAGLMTLAMLVLLVRSTSSAAYANLILFTGAFLIWHSRAVVGGRRPLLIYAVLVAMVPGTVGAAVLVQELVPIAGDFLDTTLFSKLQSHSGSTRMSWNLQALINLLDTYGLGAGIGSVRASGWVFACLGNLGLIGTAVYLWLVARILLVRLPMTAPRGAAALVPALQTASAAVVLQAAMLLPYPNLGMPFFAMAGVIAGLTLRGSSFASGQE